MGIESPYEALLESKALKEEGYRLFKTKAYRPTLNLDDKSMQYLCVCSSKWE